MVFGTLFDDTRFQWGSMSVCQYNGWSYFVSGNTTELSMSSSDKIVYYCVSMYLTLVLSGYSYH